MIKLTQLIPEVVRLNSVKELDPIKDELAAAAQQEYETEIQRSRVTGRLRLWT